MVHHLTFCYVRNSIVLFKICAIITINAGIVGSAAYKKWEKAAMAGVSLVADAAEQLERANLNKDHSIALPNMICSHNGKCPSKHTVTN
jgi:hypothetical protein